MNRNDESIIIAAFGGACFFMLALIVAYVFYLATIAKCYRRISRRNRRMDPAHVWLNLIPAFNTVWMPITLDRLTEALRDEYDDLRIDDPGDGFGRPLWIAYQVLIALSGFLLYFGACTLFVAIIIWIIYWVKLAAYSRQLAVDPGHDDDPRDDAPPRDDDPRPARRSEDDDR